MDDAGFDAYKSGDIVTMQFNGHTKVLSYQVNEGIKRDIFTVGESKTGYRMAVHLSKEGESIQILSYKQVAAGLGFGAISNENNKEFVARCNQNKYNKMLGQIEN